MHARQGLGLQFYSVSANQLAITHQKADQPVSARPLCRDFEELSQGSYEEHETAAIDIATYVYTSVGTGAVSKIAA